jgi:tripartite-type tricarboxylate transporter receptor subunit TctC
LPVDNLAQFIELLKASPGKYAYGSSGSGAPLHLAGELFNHVAQVDTLHVPYKGAGPAMVDLLGGRITYMFDTFAATNAHVRAGKLKRLGVASDRRYKGAPQLHTLKEDGCNVVANTWSGIFAPAGTPKNIVDALNAGFRKTMADPSLEKLLNDIGFEAVTDSTPESFRQFVSAELSKWATVVAQAGIKNT